METKFMILEKNENFKRIISHMLDNENCFIRQFGNDVVVAELNGFKKVLKAREKSVYRGVMLGERGPTCYVIKALVNDEENKIEISITDSERPSNYRNLKILNNSGSLTYCSEFDENIKVVNFNLNNGLRNSIVVRNVEEIEKNQVLAEQL